MSYPVSLPTKQVSFGSAAVLEGGAPLAMRVTVSASRSLVHRPSGTPLIKAPTQFSSAGGGAGAITLPICDSTDMGVGDGTSIVLDSAHPVTHLYSALVNYYTDDTFKTLVPGASRTVGPFALLSSSPSVSDVDDLLVGSPPPVAGETVMTPGSYTALGLLALGLPTDLDDYPAGGGASGHVPSRYAQAMADEVPFTTPPTFTEGASNSTTSTLTSPRNYPTVINDALNPLFTYAIMDPTVAGGGVIALDASAPDRYINYDHAFTTSFDFDGQVFEIDNQWNDVDRVSLRVWANEKETATFTGITAANRHLLKVDFGSRAYRRITLESDSANLLLGINVPGTDTITKATPRSPLKLAVVGDSLSLGVGVKGYAPSGRSYALTMARCLGFTNWFRYGISGSGFVTGGSSYLTRIGPVVNGSPDIVIVQGSYNDTANQTLQTAVVAYLNALRAALPDATILLTGSLQSTGNDSGVAALNAVLSAAATTAGVPFIDTKGWINAGNKARYSAPEYGDHLTYEGSVYMGRQLAREVARVLNIAI